MVVALLQRPLRSTFTLLGVEVANVTILFRQLHELCQLAVRSFAGPTAVLPQRVEYIMALVPQLPRPDVGRRRRVAAPARHVAAFDAAIPTVAKLRMTHLHRQVMRRADQVLAVLTASLQGGLLVSFFVSGVQNIVLARHSVLHMVRIE